MEGSTPSPPTAAERACRQPLSIAPTDAAGGDRSGQSKKDAKLTDEADPMRGAGEATAVIDEHDRNRVDPCERCGSACVPRCNYGGLFVSCENYPRCRYSRYTARVPDLRLRLEILSAESVGLTIAHCTRPGVAHGEALLRDICDRLRSRDRELSTYTIKEGRSAMFRFKHMSAITRALRACEIACEGPPRSTERAFASPARFINADAKSPSKVCAPNEDDTERRWRTLPTSLRDALLPFQRDGVRYALRRSGRCLIADEMGMGKSLQALAVAACYQEEWPLLIITCASLRIQWADEVERWMPWLGADSLVVLRSARDKFALQSLSAGSAKVVISSYHMFMGLTAEIEAAHKWKVVIVDESHALCRKIDAKPHPLLLTMRPFLRSAARAVLLSGTPSMNEPFALYFQVDALREGVLGSAEQFAHHYCNLRAQNGVRVTAGASRARELHALLTHTVMLRRTKRDVFQQLPSKIREVLLVEPLRRCSTRQKSGLSSASSCDEWEMIAAQKIDAVVDCLALTVASKLKAVVFAHRQSVLDELQAAIERKSAAPTYVRLDGQTPQDVRYRLLQQFRSDVDTSIALVSVTAGGVGLDLSVASVAIFAELPPTATWSMQAEGRLHRRGQAHTVHILYVLLKESADEQRFQTFRQHAETADRVCDGTDTGEGFDVEHVTPVPQTGLPPPAVATCSVTPADADQKRPPEGAIARAQTDAATRNADDVASEAFAYDVSEHTGRVHVFQAGGREATPCKVNFRPQEAERLRNECSADPVKSVMFLGAIDFLREWSALREYDRRALRGRARTAAEVREAAESVRKRRHKSPTTSRRRSTPSVEFPLAVPAGAHVREVMWMSSSASQRGWRSAEQAVDAAGEALCVVCSKPTGCREVRRRIDMFCSSDCSRRKNILSGGAGLRRELAGLENARCTKCGLDCYALLSRISRLEAHEREAVIVKEAPAFRRHPKRLKLLVQQPVGGHLWHADHIRRVVDGGGECDADNLRTLCVLCHQDVTYEKMLKRSPRESVEAPKLTEMECRRRAALGEDPDFNLDTHH